MMSSQKATATLKVQDVHQLQAIAEAAARIAEQLAGEGAAESVRDAIRAVDDQLGDYAGHWDEYAAVNDWSSTIKGGLGNHVKAVPATDLF